MIQFDRTRKKARKANNNKKTNKQTKITTNNKQFDIYNSKVHKRKPKKVRYVTPKYCRMPRLRQFCVTNYKAIPKLKN